MAEIKKLSTMNEFLDFIGGSSSLNVVKFSADWCFPCKSLGETIKSLGTEDVDGVLLGEVDVDDEWFDDMSGKLGIRGVPVLIAFNDGQEKERSVGAISKDALIDFFRRNK